MRLKRNDTTFTTNTFSFVYTVIQRDANFVVKLKQDRGYEFRVSCLK